MWWRLSWKESKQTARDSEIFCSAADKSVNVMHARKYFKLTNRFKNNSLKKDMHKLRREENSRNYNDKKAVTFVVIGNTPIDSVAGSYLL